MQPSSQAIATVVVDRGRGGALPFVNCIMLSISSLRQQYDC